MIFLEGHYIFLNFKRF